MSLQKIGASNLNQANSAAGLYHKIFSGKICSLVFHHQVLSIMHGLSKAMQEINVKGAARLKQLQKLKKKVAKMLH